MNYGGSLSELRGWTEAFPDVDPITGREWRHTSRDVRALALDGIIDLTDSDTRDVRALPLDGIIDLTESDW